MPYTLTPEEAITLLSTDYHAFALPLGGMILGADWDEDAVHKYLNDADFIQLSDRDFSGHAIGAFKGSRGYTFSCDMKKVNAFRDSKVEGK